VVKRQPGGCCERGFRGPEGSIDDSG
jgi:hypothetical protein